MLYSYIIAAQNSGGSFVSWAPGEPAGREGYSVMEGTNWYGYCSNNPVRFVDPTGMEHTVTGSKEKGYTIIIPVEFKGDNWTKEMKREFEVSIESTWSGFLDGVSVNVDVDVVETNKGKRNKIRFQDREGRAYAILGNSVTLFKNSSGWTMAHEAGHLMGLDDRYKDKKQKEGTVRSVPNPGWEENIMAEYGGTVDEKNFEEIIQE